MPGIEFVEERDRIAVKDWAAYKDSDGKLTESSIRFLAIVAYKIVYVVIMNITRQRPSVSAVATMSLSGPATNSKR
jgi:hypothetical protein